MGEQRHHALAHRHLRHGRRKHAPVLRTPLHRDTVPSMKAAIAVPAARKRTASLRFTTTTLLSLALAALASNAAAAGAPPANKLEFGFEERVRSENWDNSTDFNQKVVDARHQWRFRTRAWTRWNAGANTEFVLGLANESRKLTTPHVALTMDETVVENLYLDHRFSDGASVRIGRQNLTRGDGFILMDGSPLDGSRVAYFNALDLGWTSGKSRLDLLIISDPHRDEYLPRIHDRTKSLIEWDENALGLYWTGANRAKTTLDAYYFYKAETGDTRAGAARQGARMFHTLGGRCKRDFAGDWSVKAELAGQAGGQQPGSGIRAWGTQASVKRSFAHTTKPSLLLAWTGLSGDDPATAANEGWDPLFARYPKWSELYIYTQASERGAAYWTNLSMWQAEARLTPLKPLDLRATYYHMGAFHHFPGKPAIYANGARRGDLYEARADLKVNDNWRGHVVGEYLKPGGFYAGGDGGWFFRAEASCSFKRVFAR